MKRNIKYGLWAAFLLVSMITFGPLTQGELHEAERIVIIGNEPFYGQPYCYNCHIPGGQ